MNTLDKLAEKYIVDKCPKYFHYYTPEYDKILKNKKYNKILEIGIGYPELMKKYTNNDYQSGASLFMWRDYFKNSIIYGLDIHDIKLNDNRNIYTYKVDQSNEIELINTMDKIGNCDMIIDDGSHILEHQIISFKTLWKYCNDIYIIEDVDNLDLLENNIKNLFNDCILLKKYKHPKDSQGFLCFQKYIANL